MLYDSEGVQVKGYKKNEELYLHFKFVGRITKESCDAACKEWRHNFHQDGFGVIYNVVCDCTALKGFCSTHKNEWFRTIKLFKRSIKTVIIVSDNIIFIGLTKLISYVVPFQVETLRLHEYLERTL